MLLINPEDGAIREFLLTKTVLGDFDLPDWLLAYRLKMWNIL
jgi:hypothetical protein